MRTRNANAQQAPLVRPFADARLWALWLPTGILLLAAFVRLHHLGSLSLWMDEAVSVFAADALGKVTLEIALSDSVHPPLYYFVQKLSGLLGWSEFALRWPAAMLGVVAVASTARLAKSFKVEGGRSTAIMASLFVALSPFSVWYGREARMYTMLMVLHITVIAVFADIVSQVGRKSSQPSNWAANTRLVGVFSAWSALAYLTHYFALFLPLIQFAFLALTLRRNYRILRPWMACQLVAGLPIGWWIVALYSHGASFGIGWIHPPHIWDPLLTAQNFAAGYGPEAFRLAATVLCLALAAAGLWKMRHTDRGILLALWIVLPAGVTLALSFRRPAYVDRFLIGSLPALMLAAAAGAIAVARRVLWLGVLSASLVTVFLAWGTVRLFDNHAYPKEDWRGLAEFIAANERPGDTIVLRAAYYLLPFRYYYHGALQPMFLDDQELSQGSQGESSGRLWLAYRGKLEDSHRFAESIPADIARDEPQPQIREQLALTDAPNLVRRDFDGLALIELDGVQVNGNP